MTEDDARRTLNVTRTASAVQIRQAYLDLVKVWHPDRFGHDERLREKAVRALQDVNEAYAVLQRGPSRPSPTSVPTEDAPTQTEAPPFQSPPAASSPPGAPQPAQATWSTWIQGGRYRLPILIGSAIGVLLAVTLIAWRTPEPPPPDADLTATAPAAADIELAPRTGRAGGTARRRGSRPESGTDVRAPIGTGRGTLSIRNDATADAVIVMRGEREQRRTLYVRRGEKITMLDVAPGEYEIVLLLGTDWLGQNFAEPAGYLRRTTPVQVPAAPGSSATVVVLASTSPDLRPIAPFLIE